MENPNLLDAAAAVNASEIRWTPPVLPRLELVPPGELLDLEFGDLLVYVLDLQETLTAVRSTLHASVHAHHRQHAAYHALDRRHRQVLEAHRALREQVRA